MLQASHFHQTSEKWSQTSAVLAATDQAKSHQGLCCALFCNTVPSEVAWPKRLLPNRRKSDAPILIACAITSTARSLAVDPGIVSADFKLGGLLTCH